MSTTTRKLRAYVDHFLPREVVGPVIIVFSLEGVIDGIFTEYVPAAYETLGWGIVFLFSIVVVAYWGSVDEEGLDELEDRLDEIEEESVEGDGS
ncbi:hypothetical protein [Haloparvum sp. AD34]